MEQEGYSINTATSRRVESVLIVPPRPGVLVAETEKTMGASKETKSQWTVSNVSLPPPHIYSHAPVMWQGSHPAINEFVTKASQVAGIQCIVVEDVDGQIFHVTTFAEPFTEDARSAIYEIEAQTIRAFPTIIFDFHLRRASETEGGTPTPVPGQNFFAVWGSLHEKPK